MTYTTDDLKICFYLKIGPRFYGEQMIARRWAEVQKAVKDKVLKLRFPDGAISMRYRGQELYGIKLWTEMESFCNSLYPPEFLRTGHQHLSFPNQVVVEFDLQENEVLYHLRSYAPGLQEERRQQIPLQPLIKEWSLMLHRYERLLAELGSEDARRDVAYGGNFVQAEWRAMVGEEAIARVTHADIRTLLLESSCAGGYLRLSVTDYVPLEEE